MPRIACWRSAGVIFAIASRSSGVGCGMPSETEPQRRSAEATAGGFRSGLMLRGSMFAGLAARSISARSMGSHGASSGELASRSSQRLERRPAVARLRLVQAEIEERARIVRAAWRARGGRRRPRARVTTPSACMRERLAQRRQGLGIVGLLLSRVRARRDRLVEGGAGLRRRCCRARGRGTKGAAGRPGWPIYRYRPSAKQRGSAGRARVAGSDAMPRRAVARRPCPCSRPCRRQRGGGVRSRCARPRRPRRERPAARSRSTSASWSR